MDGGTRISGAAVGVLAVVGCATAISGFTVGGGSQAHRPACDKQALERLRNECLRDGWRPSRRIGSPSMDGPDPLDFCGPIKASPLSVRGDDAMMKIICLWRFGVDDAKFLRADADGTYCSVMPGPNTSFVSFQNDQATCRQFADQAVVDQAQGANLRALGTAALTTALGAGLGGAVGGGRGAGIGAASGALGGAGLGAVGSANAQRSIQAQYDNAFAACMFSLGNTVPGMGPMMTQPQGAALPPPR